MAMNDDQVCTVLERISPKLLGKWKSNEVSRCNLSMNYDPQLRDILYILAESQKALGEINKKVCKAIYYLMKDSPKYPDGRSKEISYFEHGMDRLMDAKKIVRNARKGGSNG